MKYKLDYSDTRTIAPGRTVKRIRALVAIAAFDVSPGDAGGYVESESCLAQTGDAWVFGNAQVYDNAQVSGDARVSDNAWVFGNAQVSGDALVSGNAWVFGDARVSGNAWVFGNAQASGNAWVFGDARVSGNAQASGNAWVFGDARVSGNAQVSSNAQVSGDARVSGNAQVSSNAQVSGNARVSGNAQKTPLQVGGLTYAVTILDAHMLIGCEFHPLADWASFDDARITAMDGKSALRFWRAYRDVLLGMARADGRMS